MDNEIEEKTLTLKSLKKEVDAKLKELELKIEIIKKSLKGRK